MKHIKYLMAHSDLSVLKTMRRLAKFLVNPQLTGPKFLISLWISDSLFKQVPVLLQGQVNSKNSVTCFNNWLKQVADFHNHNNKTTYREWVLCLQLDNLLSKWRMNLDHKLKEMNLVITLVNHSRKLLTHHSIRTHSRTPLIHHSKITICKEWTQNDSKANSPHSTVKACHKLNHLQVNPMWLLQQKFLLQLRKCRQKSKRLKLHLIRNSNNWELTNKMSNIVHC